MTEPTMAERAGWDNEEEFEHEDTPLAETLDRVMFETDVRVFIASLPGCGDWREPA